jgi:hypothetical protein
VGEQLEGNRGDQEGDFQLGPEDGRPRRDLRDVDQRPRAELPALVGLGVPPEGPLVARAPGEVAVGPRLELLEREALEVRDVDWIRDAPRLFTVRHTG